MLVNRSGDGEITGRDDAVPNPDPLSVLMMDVAGLGPSRRHCPDVTAG